MTLGELLGEAARAIDEVDVVDAPTGERRWSRRGRLFAVLAANGTSAEFQLDPAVATAAIRTPDTSASARGVGWVRFEPRALDPHAEDRAAAWFASAHRRQLDD